MAPRPLAFTTESVDHRLGAVDTDASPHGSHAGVTDQRETQSPRRARDGASRRRTRRVGITPPRRITSIATPDDVVALKDRTGLMAGELHGGEPICTTWREARCMRLQRGFLITGERTGGARRESTATYRGGQSFLMTTRLTSSVGLANVRRSSKTVWTMSMAESCFAPRMASSRRPGK